MAASGLYEIPIRYDGLDAERHQIDLYLLGESIRGLARILAVTGHFLSTGTYAKQFQALDVKVYVSEPKANCFSVHAVIEFAKQYQILSGSIVMLPTLLSWIFARASNNRTEMKALQQSLDKAIAQIGAQNTELVPRLLSTLERLAESLRPAMRDAVAPVGKSCTRMSLGPETVIDEPTAEAIRSTDADDLTNERSWVIRITELDRETASAKVRLEDDDALEDKRFRAVITDPAIALISNPYVYAFAGQQVIKVRGKATLKDGEIQTLFISNAE
jgi:hypothetical protein